MRPAVKFISVFSALFAVIIALSFTSMPDRDEKIQEIITRANLYNLRFPQERIYLHLDRPSYWVNDDIWFKAYAKDSPTDECNLYVELVNASGSVVCKNTAWVQNGLAYGNFHVDEELPSGIYLIRAYTNWMRNFDKVWFFRKELLVYNPGDQGLLAALKKVNRSEFDLQFFPEGGTFISGVKNRIAYKVIDSQGKGIDCDGKIFDDSGNLVQEFKSGYNGIGSFVLRPEYGRNYFAEVSFAGNSAKKIDLPEPKEEGVILNIIPFDPEIIDIQVIEKLLGSEKDRGKEYYILGQSGGKVCYQNKIVSKEEGNLVEIEKHSLPGGIIKFTLFDSNLIPVCERLVFNNHLHLINLQVKAQKQEYLPREKVIIDVAAFSDAGQAYESNLSMSVYNASAQLGEKEYPNTIFTQFLLNSELKGNIENPAFYFKDDSMSTLLALDNLMLTHGYREFEWKEILEDEFPEINFNPESSIVIKGKVISSGSGKPVVDGKITLMTVKSLLGVYEEETDSLGQFEFSDLYFYDTIYVSLKAVNKRGKSTTSIEIDTRSWNSPELEYLPYSYLYSRNGSNQTFNFPGETEGEVIKKQWNLSDTIQIDDVYILAPKREKDDGHYRTYQKADYVFEMDKQDDVLGNVFESIEGRFPGVVFEGGSFYARGTRLKIYMDGMEDKNGIVGTLPSQMFDKVEYVKSGMSAGINYPGGILFFYAKRGGQYVRSPDEAFGMTSARVVGYSVSRRFYSPVYESGEQDRLAKDIRKTIYWNPLVQTDSTGLAQLTFYQSDELGDMRVVVEGLTSDGKLCRGVSGYKVQY